MIAVSKHGEAAPYCTSAQMPWAYVQHGILSYGDRPTRIKTEANYKIYLKKKMWCSCPKPDAQQPQQPSKILRNKSERVSATEESNLLDQEDAE